MDELRLAQISTRCAVETMQRRIETQEKIKQDAETQTARTIAECTQRAYKDALEHIKDIEDALTN